MLDYTPVSVAYNKPYMTRAFIRTENVDVSSDTVTKPVDKPIENDKSLNLKFDFGHILAMNMMCTMIQFFLIIFMVMGRR